MPVGFKLLGVSRIHLVMSFAGVADEHLPLLRPRGGAETEEQRTRLREASRLAKINFFSITSYASTYLPRI